MALKDCFKKLGTAISKDDRELIESHVRGGLSEFDAVRLTLRESSDELLDIVELIYEAGVEVVRRPNPLVDARNIQIRNLEKLQRERAEVQRKMAAIVDELQAIEAVENFVANYPEQREFFVADEIDLNNPHHLNTILSSMLFEPRRIDILRAGQLGLKGDTPRKLVASFQGLMQKRFGLMAKLRTYQEQNANIDDRVRTVFHGEQRNRVLDERGNYVVMEPIRPQGPDQGDLFADPEVPASQRSNEAKANYKARVRHEEVGTLPTGLNVVKSAEDAAHVMAPIRRSATEGFWALVLDENDVVISAIRHSIGTYDGTGVYPSTIGGAVLSTPGAKKVWFAHNHPSGVSTPSGPDKIITKKVISVLKDTDVEIAGHVVIGGGGREYSALNPAGEPAEVNQPIKPLARRMKVSITERVMRSGLGEVDSITRPADAEVLINEMDPPDGVLIIDNQHRPLGFLEMSADDMKSLRPTRGHHRLLQAMSEMGGAAILAVNPQEDPALFENLGFWANANEFRTLDVFFRDDRGTLHSMASRGHRAPRSGTTYYQANEPKLQAIHNLTADNLEFSDKLGGLAVPSVAIMPEGADVQRFGEITLIGTKELGDPQQVPLFDADAYAVRFPKAQYKAALTDTVQELLDEVQDMAERIGGSKFSGLPDYLWEYMRRHPDPDRLIQHMLADNTAKAWFLSEIYGDTPEATLDDVRPRYHWGWDEAIVKFFEGDLSAEQLDWEHTRRIAHMKKAGQIVKRAIRGHFIKRISGRPTPEGQAMRAEQVYAQAEAFIARAGIINNDGTLTIQAYDTLKRDVERKGSQNINDVDTRTYLDARISQLDAEAQFKNWAERKILSRMGEPRIQISGRWEPYTLANIVRKMKRKLRGTETFFPSEGMIRAKVAKRIRSLPEARRRALEQIGTREEVDAARDEAQRIMFEWTSEMAGWWPHPSDSLGLFDRSLDAARESIVYTVQNFTRMSDAAALRAGLTRAGFEGPYPDYLIEKGLDAIAAFMQAPVPYFESKPQRAVMLDEFAGAVIPIDAKPATRAILAKHGIPYKEYQTDRNEQQNRTNAVNELQQQLTEAGERTLFQSEIGFTSGLLNAARALDLERAPAKDMLGRLRKMPGVTKAELEALDVPGYIEARGDDMLTRDELTAYIMANGLEVREIQLGGEHIPDPELTVTINSDFEMYEKYGMEEIYENEELYRQTTIWEVSDFHSDFTFDIIEDSDAGNVSVTPDDGQTWLEIDAPLNQQTRAHAEDAIEKYIRENSVGGGFAGVAENVGQQMQGGENFREILLYMPPVPRQGMPFQWEDYRGGHHDEHNIVAFFLATDRIGPNGERILFLEEVQSDWHQQGKRYGYRDASYRELHAEEVRLNNLQSNMQVRARRALARHDYLGYDTPSDALNATITEDDWASRYDVTDANSIATVNEWIEVYKDWQTARTQTQAQGTRAVPEGPFKGNAWVTLAMKRAIRIAAEQGYDQLAWSSGEIINERGGFATNIDRVVIDPRTSDVTFYDRAGIAGESGVMTHTQIIDAIGQENYDALQAQITEHANRYDILGGVEADLGNESPTRITYAESPLDSELTRLIVSDGEEVAAEFLKNEAEAGDLFVAIDENGEYYRERVSGDILVSKTRAFLSEYIENELYTDFNNLPELTELGIDVSSRRGAKMLRFYNELLINMTNKAVRKLDPNAKVQRFGQVIPDAAAFAEQLLDAQRLANMSFASMEEAQSLGRTEQATWHRTNFEGHVARIRQLEQQQVPGPSVHALDITEPVREAAMLGMTLYQDRKRGSITFDENNRAVIRLTESRNLSTFLHESGHLYLQIMGDLAEDATGPAQVISDYQKILEFLGVNRREEITREHHEKWARSFEAYLREGKAPAPELRNIFADFATWLRDIYTQITLLLKPGEELTDEIRGVMDRMIATDEAIAEAELQQEFRPVFNTAEEMGVSQEVFDVYRENFAQAHQDAVDRETRKMLAAITRAQKQLHKDEREKIRKIVEAEIHNKRVYKALTMFQRGTNPDGSSTGRSRIKLSRDDLIQRYGKEFIKKLPGRGRYGVYAAKGGTDLDIAAQIFGYTSGDEMIQEILRAGKMDAVIEAETNARMEAQFTDPLVDGTLAEDAVKAVHNEKRAQILAAELRALRGKMREDRKIVSATKREAARFDREKRAANAGMLPNRGELAIIKKLAADAIDAMRIRDVVPNRYRVAEAKAGRKAFEAATKGDVETAYQEKLKQIHNHELFRAAVRSKEGSGRRQQYLKGFESKRKQARLGKSGMLDAILAVIESIDLRKISLAEVDRSTALQQIAEAVHDGAISMSGEQADALYHVTIDEQGNEKVVLNRGYGVNWQDLTVNEFRERTDLVRQLDHKASQLAKGVLNGEKVELQKVADEISDSVLENNKFVPAGISEADKGEKFERALKQGVAGWQRPSSIARLLDQSGFGALTRRIIVPIRRAYAEKLLPMLKKQQRDMTDIYNRHYTKAEMGKMHKRVRVEAVGEDLSKSDMLTIALNMGSASNREALFGGIKRDGSRAYTEQGVQAILNMLDAKDVAFINDVWAYLDSYWHDEKDAKGNVIREGISTVEARRRGFAPPKVEAMPFTFTGKDGEKLEANGGYYPLVYDRRHSERIKQVEIGDLYKKMGHGVFIAAQTRSGSTFERHKKHGMVVRMGLHTIDLHLREVVRDIAIGDEVNFIKRLLNHKDVRKAFNNTNNAASLEALNLWLTDAAVGELAAEGVYEHTISWIRTGFVKAKLGWNLMTTALQLTGVFQTMAVIGTEAYGRGLGKFMQNPAGMYKFVMAQSAFMKSRYVDGQFDKDVIDTAAHLNSFWGPAPTIGKVAMQRAAATYFMPIMAMQSVVDVTTWLGAYWKGVNVKGYTDAEAIIYADVQVENSQTSGFYSDRSGLERGTMGRKNRQSQFIRIWTTLISYMLAKSNIAYEKGVKFKRKPTAKGAVLLATDILLLYTVEGMVAAWLYDQVPDWDDEEDDSVGWWLAKVTADSLLSGIPFGREAPGAKFGSGNTALGAAFTDIYKLGQQIEQWELDESLVKQLNKVGGTWLHYPSSQTNRLIDAYWSEEEPEAYEWFTGERRDDEE